MMRKDFKIVLIVIITSISILNIVYAYPDVEIEKYYEKDYGFNVNSTPQQSHVVFSNKTGLFYYFYYSSYDLCYDVITRDGYVLFERNKIIESGLDDGYAYSWTLEDYDVSIDLYGEKIYIFIYHNKALDDDDINDALYCYYCIVNDNTLKIDVLDKENLDIYLNRRTKHVDGFVSRLGYPVCTYEERIGAGVYSQRVSFSNSITEWNGTYTETVEDIYIGNGGANPPNHAYAGKIIPYRENGIAVIWACLDAPNGWRDYLVAELCRDHRWVIESSNISAWSNSNLDFDTYYPDTEPFLFTATGKYNEKWDMHVVSIEENNTHTMIKDYHRGYWGTLKQEIKGFAKDVSMKPYVVMNDRGNVTIVYISENDLDKFYGFTFNKSKNKFDENQFIMCDTNDDVIGYYGYVNYGSDYALEFGYKNGTSGQIQWERTNIYNDSVAGFGWFYLDNYSYPRSTSYPVLYNLTIDGISGNYLFENEIYDLIIETNNTQYLNASFTDGINVIEFTYNKTYNSFEVNTNGDFTISLFSGIYEEKGSHDKLIWRFALLRNIIDSEIILNATIQNEFGNITITYNNLFNGFIYNLGGYTYYEHLGNGQHIRGGDTYDLSASLDGSMINASSLYRRLQHVNLVVEFELNGTWNSGSGVFNNLDGGYFEYGLDYFVNGIEVKGQVMRIYPSAWNIGHHIAGSDHNWIDWIIEFYHYNYSIMDYTLDSLQHVHTHSYGYDNENSTPDHWNRTGSTFYIDIWLDRENFSNSFIYRISSQYYGFYEQGVSWWFGYGAFRPLFSYSYVAEQKYNLTGVNNTLIQNTEIEIVKFWCSVNKVSGQPREYKMYNYQQKNFKLAEDRYLGIDKPPLIEPITPDIPKGGFLSPLIKAIESIGGMFRNAILSIIKQIVFMGDTFFEWLGLPPIFSGILEFVRYLISILNVLIVQLSNMITYMIESIITQFNTIFLVIPKYLYFVGMVANIFISYYTTIVSLFTGGWLGVSNIWIEYSLFDWIQLYLICIFPFVEIAKISSADDPMEKLVSEIKSFVGLLTGISKVIGWFISLLMSIYNAIRGLLPF